MNEKLGGMGKSTVITDYMILVGIEFRRLNEVPKYNPTCPCDPKMIYRLVLLHVL